MGKIKGRTHVATMLPVCSCFSVSHNSGAHPAHTPNILAFAAASFIAKSDKQCIEGGEMLQFFRSEVPLSPGAHVIALLISVCVSFSEISPFRQACGKQTTSPAIYCCSSQNLHFKNPLKHEVLPTCFEFGLLWTKMPSESYTQDWV